MIGKSALLVLLVAAICPACGVSPDLQAPQGPAAAARAVDVDAPNGVCRSGAHIIPHIGCVDDGLSFSQASLDACRSTGEPECSARCQKGDAPSCTGLALVHAFGLETSSNTAYAAQLLDRSCAAGDGAACTDLGVLHARGLGFPVDVERAETLYAVACDHGDIVGCANLASSRTWGADPPTNVLQALRTVESACGSGEALEACGALGLMRARGSGIDRDEHLAAKLFTKACDAGDVVACDRLGKAYLAGDGVTPDDVTALQLFRRGCDRAQAEACTDLANMYCMGRGIPRDAPRSTALLHQTCEAGDPVACHTKTCGGWAPM
jgi:TPR repeat protein